MYNQLIYFIVVLLLFSVQRQTGKPPATSWSDALYIAALFCFFIFYCRRTFERIVKAADQGVPLSALTRAHYRSTAILSVTAIGFLAVYVYCFNLGAYLRVIPGYDKFMTISGIAGLVIFLVHLAVIWYWSHPTYQIIFGAKLSRTDFIKGQLSFTSVILIPWFLISTVTDLLQFIKTPSFMASDLGQILLISLALISFVLFGPWLIIRMWGCKPLPQDHVRAELERFCSDHDFRTGGLLLWSILGTEVMTAGVVGILPSLRYILITSGLLGILDVGELKAVVAHEMGHVRKKHMLLFVFLLIMLIVLTFYLSDPLVDTLSWLVLSNRTVLNWAAAHGDFAASLYYPFSVLPMILIMVLYFRFIFGYFLRNSERQADLYALELVGDPYPLTSSLEKIAFRSGRIEDLPSWHHYGIRQRVDFLVEAFKNRSLIRKHNRKLYGSVLIFTVAIWGLLFVNWKASEAGFVKNLRSEVQLRTLEQRISEEPGNVEFLAAYGGILYEKGRYSEAESVLRAALTHDPKNASVLNNLAWLYATGPSPFRNPREALDLALKAAAINPAPDILDTLAEAYYINGRYADALSTIEDAISQGGPQQSHFLKQKEKFEKALSGKMRSS
jgi:Zn-dependent protease with chaperone function